jgi:hypothetical protein
VGGAEIALNKERVVSIHGIVLWQKVVSHVKTSASDMKSFKGNTTISAEITRLKENT